MQTFQEKIPTIPEHVRILDICESIHSHQLTPKKFFFAFLKNTHEGVVSRWSKWSGSGLPTTMELLLELVLLVKKKPEGRQLWEDFLLNEAVEIVERQRPPSGNYPKGLFQSSNTITLDFLDEKTQQKYINMLTEDGMPFLYSLVYRVLWKSNDVEAYAPVDGDDQITDDFDHDDEEGLNMEEIAYGHVPSSEMHRTRRFKSISTLVCGMIAFARNRRHNGIQIKNALQLVSCGVTDRVNQFLMYHGLVCGQRTAMAALKTLSSNAEARIKDFFSDTFKNFPVSPIICIDNLDIEERVHTHAVGNRTRTFHGTWGYFHLPPQDLLDTLDMSEITLDKFSEAMRKVPTFSIQPSMFMPTLKSEESYKLVWKSQIARVMNQYIAAPHNYSSAISLDPPVVEQISNTPPNIQMLKLMDASENSADGIGKVLNSVVKQTGLSPEEFFGKLVLMDGDLATCRNFNSL
ncbi:hypothetical protein PGT21_006018 [Puccinia graminis f. sp. tritici]|uniref:DUF6589 domain-containing protein n=1 Tax=Puccinia graminis f. sp. tritici TaxID=56615 RepID=A0A5B0N3B8_PUCGR|nr:hypothetical protein PGT21_006018 [Puccinia graminis f. sp. tritici]KAA1122897.1 hypothetical protein PGTUg99_011300 [Puccinia graminis f. sp. tritici]